MPHTIPLPPPRKRAPGARPGDPIITPGLLTRPFEAVTSGAAASGASKPLTHAVTLQSGDEKIQSSGPNFGETFFKALQAFGAGGLGVVPPFERQEREEQRQAEFQQQLALQQQKLELAKRRIGIEAWQSAGKLAAVTSQGDPAMAQSIANTAAPQINRLLQWAGAPEDMTQVLHDLLVGRVTFPELQEALEGLPENEVSLVVREARSRESSLEALEVAKDLQFTHALENIAQVRQQLRTRVGLAEGPERLTPGEPGAPAEGTLETPPETISLRQALELGFERGNLTPFQARVLLERAQQNPASFTSLGILVTPTEVLEARRLAESRATQQAALEGRTQAVAGGLVEQEAEARARGAKRGQAQVVTGKEQATIINQIDTLARQLALDPFRGIMGQINLERLGRDPFAKSAALRFFWETWRKKLIQQRKREGILSRVFPEPSPTITPAIRQELIKGLKRRERQGERIVESEVVQGLVQGGLPAAEARRIFNEAFPR